MRHLKQTAFACAAILMTAGTSAAIAQGQPPVKIGFPVFLSGPAVGAFGEPSQNAAQLIVRAMNTGELPAPYNQKGLAGIPIELKIIDEAGSTATAVTEFKNLVQRDKVDVVVGYVSSASCPAIAPVADELEVLTVFYACGASRLFDERDYKYVFRSRRRRPAMRLRPHANPAEIPGCQELLRNQSELLLGSGQLARLPAGHEGAVAQCHRRQGADAEAVRR